MDLNDPRRRLQVLNNASPSIRMATAPQQPKISIAQPKAPSFNIVVPQGTPNAAPPQAKPNTFKALSKSNEKNKTIFGWNAAAVLPKGFEKTASYGAGKDFQANPQDFLKQFDGLDEAGGIKGAYVADLQKKSATDPVASATLKLLQENGRFKGSFDDFASGANDKLYGGMSRGFLRGVDFVLPGKNTFGLEKEADRQEAQPQFTSAGKAGEKFGSVEKGIVDVASLALGAGAAEQAAGKVPLFANLVDKLSKGGKISRVAGKMVGALPGSFAGSGVDVLQTAGRGDEQNVGKSVALGTAIDVGLPFVGTGLRKGFNLFKGEGKGVSKSVSFVEDLIGETDPSSIKKVLGVDNEMATYLASETNPSTVKQILADLQVDPNFNIPPEVRQRLEEEGITAVKRDPNDPYGASYKDNAITASSQEELDKNVYHELGHSIWQNKLTPEEKALFTGQGAASKEAVGRAGYTAEDVISEDFSDYMRMATSGRLNEVPQELQDVVQKYARVAAQDATTALPNKLPQEDIDAIKAAGGTVSDDPGTVFHLPQAGVHAKISKEQAEFLKDETKNIPWSANDRPHLSAGEKVREATKEVTLEELGKLSPNAQTALDNAAKQVPASPETAQVVDDVSKAQTGTSDGKTTSPEALQGDIQAKVDESTINGTNTPQTAVNASEALSTEKGIKFRDPETKKQIQRTYEDVQAEVDKLKQIPEDQLTKTDKARLHNLETKMARHRSENAKYAFPDADPDSQKAIQEVMDQLAPAQREFNKVQKTRSGEKAARIQKGGASYEAAGGGEAGVRAKLGSLKGKYSESGFNPITASESTQKSILDDIEKSGLRDFEKLNTQNAIRKIWGANDAKPTGSDINYIRKYFGDDMADSVKAAIDETPDTWRDTAAKIAGTPRALMSTMDFSFGGRQGAPLGTRFPKEWAVANKESVKYAANREYFDRAMKEIRGDDAFETINDKMKVALTGASDDIEEGFAAADFAEAIPVYGKGVEASSRAYTGGLTKLRFDTAKKVVDSYGGVDAFNKFFEGNDKAIRELGEVINTFSGRGGKAGGLVEQHMKTLSTTLFAPRLWAAKLNSLNPAFYARLSPEARKLALQTQASFLTTAGTVLAIASAAGATVVWDPRSADFAKIKVGNTRYDILGGLQQNIRLGAQLATGEKINSTTGELQTLGDGFGKPSRKDILFQAFESKENPLLAYASKILEGKDKMGEPVNPLTEAGKLAIPLNFQSNYETAKDRGSLTDPKNLATSAAMSLPGFFGAGVQTYGNIATKDKGKEENGKLTFGGKITDDMPLDSNGRPFMDEKGKVVKVKFDKDRDYTAIEKKAMLDEAKREAQKSEFKRSLSKEDQALMKLSDDELKGYVENNTIDQEKFDQIQRFQKGSEDYGNEIKVPDGVKSTSATAFYKKYNSMTKKDQEYWLKEPADENSKTITSLLNKERSEGLSEFKPSNEVAKAYSEYEKDLNEHPEYTEVDKRNKAKAFQTYVYKQNYSDDQRDIFAEGGSVDLKTLIDEKSISKEDLDAAIKMDDELYNSGLTGSLKFSKKFRASYAYGLPTGGGRNVNPNSGGSGSGGKSDDVNAHLADYLPSESSSKGTPAPQFSSKRRTGGISFKSVNTPSKGSGKKISINL